MSTAEVNRKRMWSVSVYSLSADDEESGHIYLGYTNNLNA